MASLGSDVISVETIGTSTSSSNSYINANVTLPPIRPISANSNNNDERRKLSNTVAISLSDNKIPCQRCQFGNEFSYNFCIKCGYALPKSKGKNKSKNNNNKAISSSQHINKGLGNANLVSRVSQSAGSSFDLKEQILSNIRCDYSTVNGASSTRNKHNNTTSKQQLSSKSKGSVMLTSSTLKSIGSNRNINPNASYISKDSTGNSVIDMNDRSYPSSPHDTSQPHPITAPSITEENEGQKSLNATWSAASILTTSTLSTKNGGDYDAATLDLPPPVLKALNTKLEPNPMVVQRQREALQEKLMKASLLEITNAELLERMYSKLSLLSELQRLPRMDSNMSVESLDSVPNYHQHNHYNNGNSFHNQSSNTFGNKKLKSKRSMMSSSSSMYNSYNKNHIQSDRHNQSFLSLGSIVSAPSVVSSFHPLQQGGNSAISSATSSISHRLERKPSKYARHNTDYLNQFESVVSMREKILEEKKVSAGILGLGSVLISDTVDKRTPSRASSRLSMPKVEDDGSAWLWGDCFGKSIATDVDVSQTTESDQILRNNSSSPTLKERSLHSSPSMIRLSTIMSRSTSSLNEPDTALMNESQKSLLHTRSTSKMKKGSSAINLKSSGSFYWGSLISGKSEQENEQAKSILSVLDDETNEVEEDKIESSSNHDNAEDSVDEVEDEDNLTFSTVNSMKDGAEEVEEEEQCQFFHGNVSHECTNDDVVVDRKKTKIKKTKNKLSDIASKPLVSLSSDVPDSVKSYQNAIEEVNDILVKKTQKASSVRIDTDDENEEEDDACGRHTQSDAIYEDDKRRKEIEEEQVRHNAQMEHRDHFILLDLSKQYLSLEDDRRTISRMQTLNRLEEEMNRPPTNSSSKKSPSKSKTQPSSSHSDSGSDGEDNDFTEVQLFQSPFALSESPYLAMFSTLVDSGNEDERRIDVSEEIYIIQEERDRLEELREANTKAIQKLVANEESPSIGMVPNNEEINDELEEGDALLHAVFHKERDRDLYTMDSEKITKEQQKREQYQLEEEHSFANLTASFDSFVEENDERASKRATALSIMEGRASSAAATKRDQRNLRNQNSVLAQTLRPLTSSAEIQGEADCLGETSKTEESNKAAQNINFNSNLTIGKFYMMSYERMKKSIDNIFVDFRIDVDSLSNEEIDTFRNNYDRARVALMLGQEVNQQVMNELKLFHERASLQRSTIAFNISESLVKATTMDRFFREQYEKEREIYLKTYVPVFKRATKIDLVSDEMKEIQERGNLAMQQIGNQIKELQVAEQQILRALKQEDFTIHETIGHWRPKHAKRLTELTIAIGRAEGWLKKRKGLVI